MDRQQVINKIKAMLKLQEATDFEGEASAAANLIDKLCKEYNVTLNDVERVEIIEEVFESFKKINVANCTLLDAVANFYDAKLLITKNRQGQTFLVVGSEGQQIQTRLYYDYLKGVMDREADIAYSAEKVLANINGFTLSRSFKINFRKAFAEKVEQRLKEMKIKEGRAHEHKQLVCSKLTEMEIGPARNLNGSMGSGAHAGANVGAGVSLHRQTSGGGSIKQLCGV